MVRTKQRKKIARRQRVAMPGPIRPGQCWSMDFVSDRLADGRGFRILTVVDQFTRECVLLEAERSMSGAKVAEALQRVIDGEGAAPESITCDNGSEFAGRVLEAWAIEAWRATRLHPSGSAGGEWIHRKLQRTVTRRIPERGMVRLTGRGAAQIASIAPPLQPSAAT